MVRETIKICVLGDEGVGKSSITLQYTQAHFPKDFDPTIEDIYTKDVTVDRKRYALQILDTAVQDEYSPLKDLQFEQADGFVLVFRVDSTESLNFVTDSYRHIKRIHGEIPPVVLLGNKCELETERLVRVDEAEGLVNKLNLRKYFDVSAKNNYMINEAFEHLTNLIIEQKNEKESIALKPELLKQSTETTDSSKDSSTMGKSSRNSTQSKLGTSTNGSVTFPRIQKASTFTINTSDHKLSSFDGLREGQEGDVNTPESENIPAVDEKSDDEEPSQTKLEKTISSTEKTRNIPQNSAPAQRNNQTRKPQKEKGDKCCIIM